MLSGSYECERPWYPTSFSEIMIFIGAVIYMGVYKEPQIPQYWSTDIDQGPLHTISHHLGLKHYEQLWCYDDIYMSPILGLLVIGILAIHMIMSRL